MIPPASPESSKEDGGRANALTQAWEQYRITHQHPEVVQVIHDRLIGLMAKTLVEHEERLSSLETKPRRRSKRGVK